MKAAKLLAARGVPSGKGGIFSRRRLKEFPDLKRIEELPRRDWREDPELEDLIDALGERLGLPKRTNCGEDCVCRGTGEMRLRPVQAIAIIECVEHGGGLVVVRVGGGKTLISFGIMTLSETIRPLLLVPANLVEKTKRDFALLARHWAAPYRFKVMSYELLSRDRGVKELANYRPTMIIADEAHKLKNRRAAVTRRIRRYLTERPDTQYIDMSGSAMSRSIMELHHRAKWAMPEELIPLPREVHHCRDMARAVDEKIRADKRLGPGPLMRLCNDEEMGLAQQSRQGMLAAVRRAWGRRFCDTPAVIGTSEPQNNLMPITIECVSLPMADMEASFAQLRALWETPGGETFAEGSDLWRHARELSLGFYYKWDPPAPQPWLEARKEWKAFVRGVLSRSRTYDTEMQVAQACKRGEMRSGKTYERWVAIRDTFAPNTVPVWISDEAIDYSATWLERHKGIAWVDHRAAGQRLAEKTGLPYYSQKGVDQKTGRYIEDDPGGPIIASIASNREGRNLQYKWSSCLFVSCPPNGGTIEQALGRIHREGQEADEISVTILLSCIEQWEGFLQAREDARFSQETQRQYQKILVADVISDKVQARARESGNALWNK